MTNKKLYWLAAKLTYHDPMESSDVILLPYTNALWHMRFCCHICYCVNCGKWFYSIRPHAQTCNTACRKAKSRKSPHQLKSVTLPEMQKLTHKGAGNETTV